MRTGPHHLAAVLLAAGCSATAPGAPPLFSADLRSTDEQTRCDAFYELFDAPGPESAEARFAGMTTSDVRDVLGDPNRVTTLTHEGVEWLQIGYSFDTVLPRAAGEAGEGAFASGWRYAPTLVFRDRVAVPFDRMARELDLSRFSVIPEQLRFVPGGEFP